MRVLCACMVLSAVAGAIAVTDTYSLTPDTNPTYLTTDTYKDQTSAMLIPQCDDEFYAIWESTEGGFPQIFGQKLQVSDSAYIGGRKRLSIEGLPSGQAFGVRLKGSKRMAVVYIEVLTRVMIRLFDLDGEPLSRPILVESGAAVKFAPTLATVAGPLGCERAMVAWSQGDSALNPQSFGRVIDIDFLEIGELIEFREAQTGGPRVTAVQKNRFLVSYVSDSNRGAKDDFDVRGRLFDESGSPASDEFMVNIDTCGQQAMPQTIAIGDGYFVTVWSDEKRGGMYGRVFDKYAHKCGNEFVVDSLIGRPYVFNVLSDGATRVFGIAYSKPVASEQECEDSDKNADVMAALFSFAVGGDTCSAYEYVAQVGDAVVVSAAADNCSSNAQAPTDGAALTSDGRFGIAMTANDFDQSGLGVRAQLYQLSSALPPPVTDVNDEVVLPGLKNRLMRAEEALEAELKSKLQ